MAVFVLKAEHGVCYTPPPCTPPGVFADVPCPSQYADWIEAMAAEGITGGCGGGNFCPQDSVRRDQMAPFLLKAVHGPTYVPPTLQRRLRRRALPVSLRRLDRAARDRVRDVRLRRRQLLPLESEHARPDGGVPEQGAAPALNGGFILACASSPSLSPLLCLRRRLAAATFTVTNSERLRRRLAAPGDPRCELERRTAHDPVRDPGRRRAHDHAR